MKFQTEIDIADALAGAWYASEHIATNVAKTWEAKEPSKTIHECFEELADIWARWIDGEVGMSRQDKVQSLSVYVSMKLRKKASL